MKNELHLRLLDDEGRVTESVIFFTFMHYLGSYSSPPLGVPASDLCFRGVRGVPRANFVVTTLARGTHVVRTRTPSRGTVQRLLVR